MDKIPHFRSVSKCIRQVFLIALIGLMPALAFAQSRWVQDSQAQFKIRVPKNYMTNRMVEGSDIVHAFVSPDQNVAIRIRAIPLGNNAGATVEQLIPVFEQNIIKGCQRLVKQNHLLNSLSGVLCGYKWTYNNIPVGVAAFYTIQNNNFFIIWSLIPENIFQQRTSESDSKINTLYEFSGL